jgi:DNA-binding LytR/AlgR family response regulator
MRVIIIEDEKPAAEKLLKALLKYDSGIQLLCQLTNVQSATKWLQENAAPDLIFMDIELTDGLSFTIFDHCHIICPVIFTTAYDEYWQEAFEHNSIDYLLKPIKQAKLELALHKYKKLQQHFAMNYSGIFQQLQSPNQTNGYRKRFLVKKGIDLISIRTDDIAYCYAAHKLVFMVDDKAQKCIIDRPLNDLEKELDPAVFFRVNRKYLVNIHFIKRIKTLDRGKLSLELNPPAGEEISISQETTGSFKEWMDK